MVGGLCLLLQIQIVRSVASVNCLPANICKGNILPLCSYCIDRGSKSWCLDNTPHGDLPTLKPEYHGKLPGEIFDGDAQCVMQYGADYVLSPYQKVSYD